MGAYKLKTIPKTIRIDYDIYETIKKNEMELQDALDLSNMASLYNYFLRMGLERYLSEGNTLEQPVLYQYESKPHVPTEEDESNEEEVETRISIHDFHLLLKEGLYASLSNLDQFYSMADVRSLSLFNNEISNLMNGKTIDMLEPSDLYNIGRFISTYVRRFAYLHYIYYPSQINLFQTELLLKKSDFHPFLFIIDETHFIDKDDMQIVLIKDLFKNYQDLELDLRLSETN